MASRQFLAWRTASSLIQTGARTSLRGHLVSPVSYPQVPHRCRSRQRILTPEERKRKVARDAADMRDEKIKELRRVTRETPDYQTFEHRHIGPQISDIDEMLQTLGSGAETMDRFISQVIPERIISPPMDPVQEKPYSEAGAFKTLSKIFAENQAMPYLNGNGYYISTTPPVIRRNVVENPAWYTSPPPKEPEISQGRLESLLNFQTMVSDLTGLGFANSGLLDESTAAAEAMAMSLDSLGTGRQRRPKKIYVVDANAHEHVIKAMRSRAEGLRITIKLVDFFAPDALQEIRELADDLVGIMVQYPDTHGSVRDFADVVEVAREQGVLLSAGTELIALTYLKPPGEWGADIAFGNAQRLGIPLGYGGPHAAFMAVKDSHKHVLPGPLVGVSKDRLGRPAMRLALQNKSNISTAQTIMANVAAMYAVWFGPGALRRIGLGAVMYAQTIQRMAEFYGLKVKTQTIDPEGRILSDTITIGFRNTEAAEAFMNSLWRINIGIRPRFGTDNDATFAIPHNMGPTILMQICEVISHFALKNANEPGVETALLHWRKIATQDPGILRGEFPEEVRRTSPFLTHPVFNSHHSETEMLRYMNHLQSKDLSLVHSMVPLGSTTMKLTATSQIELAHLTKGNGIHPDVPITKLAGWQKLVTMVSKQLLALTDMDGINFQPNSSARAEFAGLRAIKAYHNQRGFPRRNICLIPESAHRTNFESVKMAGMHVVEVKCMPKTGNIDLVDLKLKCKKHAAELGAMVVTYPNTYGVFEPDVSKACQLVHADGGLVYMDGVNLNAQAGLTSPGALGADVCHVDLTKIFGIPQGGGSPGAGPVCVRNFLKSFLPTKKGIQVSSTKFGSASFLPIVWLYIATMAEDGLRNATKTAILNANYLLTRLKDHYPILYTNSQGRCAHQFVIDARCFKKSAGIEAIDIAKRLQDYGFHAPMVDWPIPGTLLIEPTESEGKSELDRFAEAMVSIREEIREIEDAKQPRVGNVLKNAPHPQRDIVFGDGEGKWDRPYSRSKAAYPLPYLEEKKFWPAVARIDDAYGDANLVCKRAPVENTNHL